MGRKSAFWFIVMVELVNQDSQATVAAATAALFNGTRHVRFGQFMRKLIEAAKKREWFYAAMTALILPNHRRLVL